MTTIVQYRPFIEKKKELKAQYNRSSALLVDKLESRACLSTILSYTCAYEDAQILARRLCRKGTDFVKDDKTNYLQQLCIPRDMLKKQDELNNHASRFKAVRH